MAAEQPNEQQPSEPVAVPGEEQVVVNQAQPVTDSRPLDERLLETLTLAEAKLASMDEKIEYAVEDVGETVGKIDAAMQRAEKAESTATVAWEKVEENAAKVSSQAEIVAGYFDQISKTKATIDGATTSLLADLPATEAAVLAAKSASSSAKLADEAATQALAEVRSKIPVLTEIGTRITDHEAQLQQLSKDFEARKVLIDSLLPGAASINLATAFSNQKKRLSRTKILWSIAFFLSIGGLVYIGIRASGTLLEANSWDAMVRSFLPRLTVALPLIWLALHASHHQLLAQKIEEDYAHKEAMSTAFEGYKREMLDLEATEPGAPIVTLYNNALATLAQLPGRMYDDKHVIITPATQAIDVLREMKHFAPAEFQKVLSALSIGQPPTPTPGP